MKYKISLCISALCFFTAFLILMASRTTGEEALASRIAPEILRFHVLAESDSTRDQNLKLGVKGLVLDYIHGQVPEDTDKEPVSYTHLPKPPSLRNAVRRTGLYHPEAAE